MSLQELQHRALEVANHYDEYNRLASHKAWDVRDYVSGLVGDVGDLVKATMAMDGRRDMPAAAKKVEHELNDIMWSLLLLYKMYGLNPDQSFLDAMSTLEKRVVSMKEGLA
ncbi:MAG TPA: nucleotide pyrophosphohydrolase [Candidatus Limnocylindria bacterium]|nr:nucleotide pyrophosphohydrolase [Candidatus Limnocylindria bacterium]